jgi:tetratricopeptide (TPR) repeat protein
MTPNEQLEDAMLHKSEGNKLYMKRQFTDAVSKYKTAILLMQYIDYKRLSVEQDAVFRKTLCSCLSNLAACYLAQASPDFAAAARVSKQGIALDPDNGLGLAEKLHFRRGKALCGLKRFDEAVTELKASLAYSGGKDKAVARALQDAQRSKASAAKKADKVWKGAFNGGGGGEEGDGGKKKRRMSGAEAHLAAMAESAKKETAVAHMEAGDGEDDVDEAAVTGWLVGAGLVAAAVGVGAYLWMRGSR